LTGVGEISIEIPLKAGLISINKVLFPKEQPANLPRRLLQICGYWNDRHSSHGIEFWLRTDSEKAEAARRIQAACSRTLPCLHTQWWSKPGSSPPDPRQFRIGVPQPSGSYQRLQISNLPLHMGDI